MWWESIVYYLPVGSDALISERNYPTSGTSRYNFLRLLGSRSAGFVYVYISQYTVVHNQNRFFRYYLGNKFRLDVSPRLSVKTLTRNRCEISPLTKCRINTGNKYKRLMMAYVKPKLVA